MTPDQATQAAIDELARWQGFYGLAAAASATLIGLLFVAVSLHLDMFTGKERSEARMTAEQTLTGFTFVMMFGLIFSIPQLEPFTLGIALEVMGATVSFRFVMQVVNHIRREWLQGDKHPHLNSAYLNFLVRRVLYPALSYGLVLLSGILLRNGDLSGLIWLMSITFFLIAGSLTNAWYLMVNLSRFDFQPTKQPPKTPGS